MGHDPLKLQRDAVAAAESALCRARTAMEAAATQHGISYRGLFGETNYVSRSTAERWEENARDEGRKEGRHLGRMETVDVIRVMNDRNSPFRYLRNVDLKLRGNTPSVSVPEALARAIAHAADTARRKSPKGRVAGAYAPEDSPRSAVASADTGHRPELSASSRVVLSSRSSRSLGESNVKGGSGLRPLLRRRSGKRGPSVVSLQTRRGRCVRAMSRWCVARRDNATSVGNLPSA